MYQNWKANNSTPHRLQDGPALPTPVHRFVLLSIPPLRRTVLAIGGTTGAGVSFTDKVYEWDAGAGAPGWVLRPDLTLWNPISGFLAVAYTE